MLRFPAGFVICLVVFLNLFYNYFFSVNFPFQDDFLLIQFVETVTQGKVGFTGFVKELFRTFNDHKAVVPRLIAFTEYKITGHLNFRFYIVLVLLNITYIFYFVYLQFRKTRLPLYYFIPVPFLFFHPLYHEISGWALNGMQHSFLTAFTVTAILLASKRTHTALAGALLCCFLATFTHGNGILSFPAVIFYFLCFKDFKKATVTTVVMLISLGIYLAGYESGQAVKLPTSIAVFFTSLFAFVGSGVSLWEHPILVSAIWGAVITAFMAFLFVKASGIYFQEKTTVKPGTIELLTLFAFIFITSTVIALFRSWMGTTIASRFQIYAALSMVMFYILLVYYFPVFRRKAVLFVITGLSVFYCAYSYYMYSDVVAGKKSIYLADVYNWKYNRNMFSVEKTIVRNGNFYLLPAYDKGSLKLPDPVAGKKQLDSMFTASEKSDSDYSIFLEDWQVERVVRDGKEHLHYHFLASNDQPERMRFSDNRFLVLKDSSSGRIYMMNANPKKEGRKHIITSGNYYKNGFNAVIRENDLDNGIYKLAVLDVKNAGKMAFFKLDKELSVKNGSLFLK
ncbi:hypothetical protein [Dyadobacter sediminis]|uniref:Glycosyltransferase RgtA/B/C/D-like domain-containing protein n=2 Tax=Dyadobacter sediminis TaxID=1493691 RepID=A0A5R9KAP5_9BACT|nr:hypothetical protein [Dyadobacter sediminis]TLU91797.1 hypothetical protein FEM55_13530 [Dyadobacter sediminis]GGC00186.1 hypothetical protein GCM10011325_29280 [Dyadobacter sediminis]